MRIKLTSAHKQKVVENMPVYNIAIHGIDITIPNNVVGDCDFKVQLYAFWTKHLIKNETADTNATTSTCVYIAYLATRLK